MDHSSLLASTPAFHLEYVDSHNTDRQPLEHFHNSFELVLFIKADIDIWIKDRKYDIRDGDMLFIDIFEIHRMEYKTNQPYERYVINFQYAFIKELLQTLQLESMLHTLRSGAGARIKLDLKQRFAMEADFRRLHVLQTELAADEQDATIKPAIQLQLLLLLQSFFRISQTQRQSRSYSRIDQQIQRIIQYIDKHFSEPIELEDLESVAGRSKYHLSHIFKESTRYTIIEYVHYRRIAEAQKKLLYSEQPIIDIGLACGFQSLQHFYRVFKRIAGMTPSQYRRLHREE
ncbi:AraC family transcriptional regulator [Paenibacillus sp. HB172176]|uniref:helix-turn-helix transcriptional regulator n=1 Tax=Paenibacillus sp. HB172176 TaxID=2493690 RepID=UPI00143BCF97|nr:AraC family transcriptional regulator [Paenibacillus sp. HB172176]